MKTLKSKLILLIGLLIVSFSLSGCLLYTNIKIPMPEVTVIKNADSASKIGTASCSSYVWLVTTGDCSINAAMKDGGITKVHHMDVQTVSYFLGIYKKVTAIAYGE